MKYNVMVTRTRTIISSFEFEVNAKDEEGAEEKATAKVEAAQVKSAKSLDSLFEEVSDDTDEFEYEVMEA